MMSTETAAREIRQLTDARDRGELALNDYCRRRGEILDALVGLRAVAPAPEDPTRSRNEQPTRQAAPVRPAAAPKRAPVPAPAANAAPGKSRTPLLIGVGVAALAAAAGIYFMTHRSAAPGASADPDAASVASGDAGAQHSAGPAIDEFLRRGDWSDSAISALNRAWWGLSDQEILATYSSDSAKRLSDEIGRRLLGRGRAGGAPPLDPDAPLVLLARNLNVTVPDGAIGRGGAVEEPPTVATTKGPATVVPPPVKAGPTPAAAAPPRQAPAVAATAGAKAPVAAPAQPVVAPAAPAAVASASSDPCAVFFSNPKRRSCRDEWSGGRGPDLLVLPPGRFRMGSTMTAEEQPLREDIRILRPIAMTRYEITVGDYRAYCTATKRPCTNLGGADDLPVVFVGWKDARDYATWLSEITGQHYRLPSEAEWEYAARAGTSGEPGQDREALRPNVNARFSASGAAAPAGPAGTHETFVPNEFGLFHMLGNVREWVLDGWVPDLRQVPTDGSARDAGGARVARGGSFRDGAGKVRPGAREPLDPASHDAVTGFRLVRELKAP
jgi:formylglycine-generating enzyme required for sulfatase activity